MAQKRFSARWLIRHPKATPEEISLAMDLEADISWTKGRQRITPRGTVLNGVYGDNMWGMRYETRFHEDASTFIGHILDKIEQRIDHIAELTDTGGEVTFIINLPGDSNIGADIAWTDLLRMAKGKIRFGFEVFPDFGDKVLLK